VKISLYFEELNKAYQAEIEDLRSDSEGKNVLNRRLADKRSQFNELLSMIDYAPEMVAPVFHNAITFNDPKQLLSLLTLEPDAFPAWESVASLVDFEPWADKLITSVLGEPNGADFLIKVVCLEFLFGQITKHGSGQEFNQFDASDSSEVNDMAEGSADSEDNAQDLEQAGSDWLVEQGFDRRE
jgi:hypothetical protein